MIKNTNLAQARHTIDLVFAEHVGPIFKALVDEATTELTKKGYTGPGAIHRYITLLAEHVSDPNRRTAFKQQAFHAAFAVDAVARPNRVVLPRIGKLTRS
jgi:hypothetical protein